ncbi:MAG: C-terminal helicase domain-containing protein [Chloroflexota bacterium]|nr:C-terminal helicase domain-containing protein [Chloroflexota bacterium]MDE2960567.1 C-terminal helicase domain-containing protein [Chloroflexota bacterium]
MPLTELNLQPVYDHSNCPDLVKVLYEPLVEQAIRYDRALRLEQFRKQPAGILLCTETASESLNLQFCSAVVNYDTPRSPITLEQRAGRIDHIGQDRPVVDVANLFYDGTAEHDAYQAVARRFESSQANVGEYPPIIAAAIQRIIRDESDPEQELDRLFARPDFDVNQLNAK